MVNIVSMVADLYSSHQRVTGRRASRGCGLRQKLSLLNRLNSLGNSTV
jgi:hypothetical protein